MSNSRSSSDTSSLIQHSSSSRVSTSTSTFSSSPTALTTPVSSSSIVTTTAAPGPSSVPPSTRSASVALGVLAALATLVIVIIITFRFKKRQSTTDPAPTMPPRQGKTISISHPAAQVTPFGALGDGGTVRSKHIPGSDMRVATRRLDGAWDFTDTRIPPGSTTADVGSLLSIPYSSTFSSTQLGAPTRSTCGHETKLSRELRLDFNTSREYADVFDLEANLPAPPAYAREYVGYIDHTKSSSQSG